MILHEWLATFVVVVAFLWLVPHETAAISARLVFPYDHAPSHVAVVVSCVCVYACVCVCVCVFKMTFTII